MGVPCTTALVNLIFASSSSRTILVQAYVVQSNSNLQNAKAILIVGLPIVENEHAWHRHTGHMGAYFLWTDLSNKYEYETAIVEKSSGVAHFFYTPGKKIADILHHNLHHMQVFVLMLHSSLV